MSEKKDKKPTFEEILKALLDVKPAKKKTLNQSADKTTKGNANKNK